MSDNQKKAIDANCDGAAARRVGSPWADFESSGRDKVKALAGHEVYTISPEQLAEWRKAAAPIEAKWAEGVKKAGADPQVVRDELKASLTKYGAGF